MNNKAALLGLTLAAGVSSTAFAQVSTYVTGSNLVIQGSTGDDAIEIEIGSNATLFVYQLSLSKPISCTENWVSGLVKTRTGVIASYSAGELSSVEFAGASGNDYFSNLAGLVGTLKGGPGIDVLIGGVNEDDIDGDGGVGYCNILYGGSGDDYIEAGVLGSCSGTNYVYGGDGNDTISFGSVDPDDSACALKAWGGNGDDYIIGGSSADSISGEAGDDDISTGSGDDDVWGGEGNDAIELGDGADWADGNDGVDRIYGGNGMDDLSGGYGNDTIYGDADDDIIHGGGDDDDIYGGEDNDDIYGESGRDELYGNTGRDYLSGGSGNDWLYGGDGDDDCNGGSGDDYEHINCG